MHIVFFCGLFSITHFNKKMNTSSDFLIHNTVCSVVMVDSDTELKIKL